MSLLWVQEFGAGGGGKNSGRLVSPHDLGFLMNNHFEKDILRQPGDLIKRAELAHRRFVSQLGLFALLTGSLRVQLAIGAGLSSQKALALWNEIQLAGLRELRSPNTNHW